MRKGGKPLRNKINGYSIQTVIHAPGLHIERDVHTTTFLQVQQPNHVTNPCVPLRSRVNTKNMETFTHKGIKNQNIAKAMLTSSQQFVKRVSDKQTWHTHVAWIGTAKGKQQSQHSGCGSSKASPKQIHNQTFASKNKNVTYLCKSSKRGNKQVKWATAWQSTYDNFTST